MSKTKWLILAAAVFVFGGICVVVVLAMAFGFFIGHQETANDGAGLPVYSSNQIASKHPGYRRDTLTCGTNVFVHDYEEDCLQLMTTEPRPFIGRYSFGDGKICAVPGQPVTAYIAGDVGSEMPAYVPYRNFNQPAFDWRTATFREMTAHRRVSLNQHITTTDAALLTEIVRNLRDDPPVVLPAFPFTGVTNLNSINMTCDRLPGLVFSPQLYFATNGTIYIAESLMIDTTTASTKLTARWIPASPKLTQWLNSP
jgi:hypothetical protein